MNDGKQWDRLFRGGFIRIQQDKGKNQLQVPISTLRYEPAQKKWHLSQGSGKLVGAHSLARPLAFYIHLKWM